MTPSRLKFPPILHLMFIALVPAMSGCVSYRWQGSAKCFDLTRREFKALENRAALGDGDAAMRLTKYYLYSCYDIEKIEFWCERAAILGNDNARKIWPQFRQRRQVRLEWIKTHPEEAKRIQAKIDAERRKRRR